MFECQYFTVSDDEFEKYFEAYPGVTLEVELKKMACWLDANPDRRKKKYPRFINNWLARVHGRLLEVQLAEQVRGESKRAGEGSRHRYTPEQEADWVRRNREENQKYLEDRGLV